jgi:DNA mismatch repair protein MutL
MYKIKKLPSDIINEIAAGEVIERPIAVVKELVENSIDSYADKISINIISGGLLKISVLDNGHGIDKKYLDISVNKHATSKLNKNTIASVNTLGFRGEALHAISNASEFSIISRTKKSSEAYQLKIFYGGKPNVKPSKGNIGTSVIVEKLFKNLPVRKKFLKSEKSESFAIKSFIKKVSLAYPNITFTYSEENKSKLMLIGRKGNKRYENRVMEIYGEDFKKSSFYNEEKFSNFEVKLFAGIPTFNKPNWQLTTIIINGRIIKDKMLLGVIKAAYAGLLAGNRFPVVVLYLQIESDNLDINVHPTKSEVRILNRNIINSSIIRMIRKKLETLGLRYSVEAEKDLINKIKLNNEIKFSKVLPEANENLLEKNVKKKLYENLIKEEKVIEKETCQLGFAKAQIQNMFIVAQTEDSLILVDQHAAHERIVLESLKKNYYERKIIKQSLLIPEIINLDEGKLVLLKHKDAISKLGFEFDDYGDDAIIVREIPAVLGKIKVTALFIDLQEQIKKIGDINPSDSGIEKILSKIACHNSVRAGKKLNLEEMNAILRLMEETPNSGQCNHGRPTFIKLKLKDIESLFGRI